MTDPKQRRVPDSLDHIIRAIAKIAHYTDGMDYPAFGENDLVQDAVIRNLEIIGEASNRIAKADPDFWDKHEESLDLSKAYEMRNVVSHGYDSINLTIVWRTIKDILPGLGEKVAAARRALTVAPAATPKGPQSG